MANNFLEIEQSQDTSNRWRNIVASIFLFFVTGWGISSYYNIPFTVFEKSDAQAASLPKLAENVFEKDVQEKVNFVGTVTPKEAEEGIAPKLPILEGELPIASDFTAKGMIVKDAESGMVLYAKNEYDERAIASITKLMSALVLLEKSLDWDEHVPVSDDDVVDTHMYAGEVYTIEALWRAALVGSSNKAVISLVDATGWPRAAFLERMNQKAVELGMTNTHFEDPTGLDARNISTAADISLLLHEVMGVNEIRQTLLSDEYYLTTVDSEKQRHIWNTNWILLNWVPHQFYEMRGGKTGYIPAAGYNFTMEVADAEGHTVDVVVLGAAAHEARFTEARDVVTAVFDVYVWPDQQKEVPTFEGEV
ncbi:MAG: serine hydrolase [Candidatus Magasanikbacteria bacterium]